MAPEYYNNKLWHKMYFIISDKGKILYQHYRAFDTVKFYLMLRFFRLLCRAGIMNSAGIPEDKRFYVVKGINRASELTNTPVNTIIDKFWEYVKNLSH